MADDWQGTGIPQQAASEPQWSGTPASAPSGGDWQGTPAAAPHKQSLWDKAESVAEGLKASYQNSALTGVLGQPVRYAMEHLDNPVTGGIEHAVGGLLGAPNMGNVDAQLKQQHPEATQEQIDQMKHNVYGNAITAARQQTAQTAAANPHGGIVGDFTAGMVAHPENLLLPGGSGATAATRIATTGGINAIASGLNDAAAQGMDILEGQKKDYDVQQSINQAAFGAGMGVFGHSAVEAAPFVKGLFKTRGIDTTPNANPVGTNAPLTTDQVNLSDADKVQLRGLMKTGSVDDIKNFLADKQGPKPTYSQVNQAVQMRDSLPEQFVNSENVLPALDQHISDSRSQAVQDHIAQTTQGWKNAPDIEYHNNVNDMSEGPMKQGVQSQIDQTGQHPPGFFGEDGKVHIFTDQVHSPEQANALLFHEGLGHFGLQEKFGAGLDQQINTLMSRNVGQFGKDVDQWQADHPGAYGGDRTRAGEEVLAEMSEKGPLKPVLADAVAAHVRRFGRAMGMKLSYSDAEVRHVLSMSHDAVINGKGRNVEANGYRSPLSFSENDPGNKFMFTGPKATSFYEHDPSNFITRRGDLRNEISDHEAYLRPMEKDQNYKLGDVLQHPELFGEYPHLADQDVVHTDMEGLAGAYSPKTKKMYINSKIDNLDPDKMRTVLHETQHAIQDHEGLMDRDETNMDKTELEHDTDPREIEAHLTEDRANMTPEERQQAYRPKFMDANRLAAMKPEDVHAAAFEKFGEDYKPKYRSQAEAEKAAEDTALDPKALKDSRGVGNLDRKLYVYNNAAKVAQDRLFTLADKHEAQGGVLTDDDKIELASATNDFHYALGRLDNDLGQVGRALNAAKNLEFRRNNIQALQKALAESGSPIGGLLDDDGASKYLSMFKTMKGNPNGAAIMMKQVSKPNWEDYVVTAHNAAMLSGVSTHVKAPQDMMIGIGRDLLNHAGSLPISAARDVLRSLGMKVDYGTHPIEVAARINGLFRAMMDSDTYRNTATTLAKGNVNPSGFSGKQNARIPVVSKVMDLISAQDTFFRAFATNMHLYGEGAKMAVDDFRNANGRNPKISEFDQVNIQSQANARTPTQKMLDTAKKMADENLLLNKNKLTEALDRTKQTTNQSGIGRRVGAFIMNILTPFVRVESNSMYNRVIRNSPLTVLDPKTWGEIKAGGRTADVAFARIAFGLMGTMAAWHASKTGKLTGEGPETPDKKAVMEATGWRPNAVHENGQYSTGNSLGQSLNPLDVHNETAMTIASIREAMKKGADTGEIGNALKFTIMATMSKLADMSYVSDLAPAMDALTAKGPTANGKVGQFLGDEASTFSPNLTAQIGRVTDQNQKQTNDPSWGKTIANSVQNTIPGARSSLPNREDPFGNTYQSGASMAGMHSWLPQDNRITGGNHQDETTDPAAREMARLSQSFDENILTPTPKTITGKNIDSSNFDPSQVSKDGKSFKLTNEQAEHYQHVAGVQIMDTLRAEMASPEWATMSDTDKGEWVRDMQKEQKKAVKDYLYGTK